MTFKETALKDLKDVFFNCDEFSEIHLINDKEIPIIIEKGNLGKEIFTRFDVIKENYERMLLFYVEREALGFLPRINNNIWFDGELWQVAAVVPDETGLLTITLGRNEGR